MQLNDADLLVCLRCKAYFFLLLLLFGSILDLFYLALFGRQLLSIELVEQCRVLLLQGFLAFLERFTFVAELTILRRYAALCNFLVLIKTYLNSIRPARGRSRSLPWSPLLILLRQAIQSSLVPIPQTPPLRVSSPSFGPASCSAFCPFSLSRHFRHRSCLLRTHS